MDFVKKCTGIGCIRHLGYDRSRVLGGDKPRPYLQNRSIVTKM
jgi:hypothetical protein